ncbi:hypothetical protein [Actinopolyspora alba]|uniref:hypothetical protein n=1 Tax=Actinopolyspora alba TaxID=673379 RepID=UPI0015876A47|nr:hypothetical protein [Actinopolyspora alba]
MTAPPIPLIVSIPAITDSALLLHPPGLFLHPSGLLLTVTVTLALALVGTLTPLRGGHGQHADSGPGALTVAQLLNQHTSAGRRALLTHPEYQSPNAARQRPRHPTSLAEEDLAELLELPAETRRDLTARPTHGERHRLVAA